MAWKVISNSAGFRKSKVVQSTLFDGAAKQQCTYSVNEGYGMFTSML